MSLPAMLDDLPTACDVGMKKDSKGYKSTWVGYKLAHSTWPTVQIPIELPVWTSGLAARQPSRHSAGDVVGRCGLLQSVCNADGRRLIDAEPIRQQRAAHSATSR